MIDGDTVGVAGRIEQLEVECREKKIPERGSGEQVVVLIPTRSIETWLAFLDGAAVDETTRYPRLDRERACGRHVSTLHEMCKAEVLRQPAPPSLEAACDEYRERLRAE